MTTFHLYTPPPPLSAYVDHLWLHEDNAQPHAQERALPIGKPALWIELGGDGLRIAPQQDPCQMTTFRTATVFGAQSRWSLIEAGRHISRMGVLFTPSGAAAFFAPPASELRDTQVPLEALWGDAATGALRERLLTETTPMARFHQLECALLARLASRPPLRPAITFAVNALLAAPQTRTIAQVVAQSGLSHQQLLRGFRREVGLTPKRFGRVRRFQQVLDLVACGRTINWAEIALTCGYADQAHLIRDFHEFAGVCPTTYLRARDPRFPTYLPFAPAAPGYQAADARPSQLR